MCILQRYFTIPLIKCVQVYANDKAKVGCGLVGCDGWKLALLAGSNTWRLFIRRAVRSRQGVAASQAVPARRDTLIGTDPASAAGLVGPSRIMVALYRERGASYIESLAGLQVLLYNMLRPALVRLPASLRYSSRVVYARTLEEL